MALLPFVLCPLSLGLQSCATPVAPTGGPVDQTAPRLVASSPEADAVQVSGRTVRLTFSERVDAATARRAVTVTPEAGPGEPAPEVSASGDEIVVTLPALRDSTTYVVTVGTELADRRGVRLGAPVTVAFSSGPTLDRGEIAGTARRPTDGSGVAGLAVFAYRVAGDSLPDPRTDRPDARTETGADGAFRLGYLADGPHFVIALRDLNRNGRADDGEPFAAPPTPRLVPTAARPPAPDSAGALRTDPPIETGPARRPAGGLDLWLARRDTVPPQIRTVRALSDRRFRLRYSEGVALPPAAPGAPQAGLGATVQDSAGAVLGTGRLYPVPGDATEVELWTAAPVRPGPARVLAPGRDSVGLAAAAPSPSFAVPDRPDTLVTRFVRFEPAAPAPDSAAVVPLAGANVPARPAVVLSGPSDAPAVIRRYGGARGDVPLDTLAVSGTVVSLTMSPDEGERSVVPTRVEVAGPDTVYAARFVRPDPDALGGIAVSAEALASLPSADGLWLEVALPSGDLATAAAVPGQPLAVGDLPPGAYRVRLGRALRRTGAPARDEATWDGGSLAPYLPPEPLVILAEPVEVRARWETEIDAALLAPLFGTSPSDAPPADAPAPAPER